MELLMLSPTLPHQAFIAVLSLLEIDLKPVNQELPDQY